MNAQRKAAEPNVSANRVNTGIQLVKSVAIAAIPGILVFSFGLLTLSTTCCLGLRPYVKLVLKWESSAPAPPEWVPFLSLAGAIGATLWVVMLAILSLAPTSIWPVNLPSDDSISAACVSYREVESSYRWLFAGLTGIWFQSCMIFALVFLLPSQSHLWIQSLCVVSLAWATVIRLAAKKLLDSAMNRTMMNIEGMKQAQSVNDAITSEINKLLTKTTSLTTTQAVREFVEQTESLAHRHADGKETLARTILVSEIHKASQLRIRQLDGQLSEGYGTFGYYFFVLSMTALLFLPVVATLALWVLIWLAQGMYTAVRLTYGLALLPVDYSEIEKAAKKVCDFEKVSITVSGGRATTIASKSTAMPGTYVFQLYAVNEGNNTLRDAYIHLYSPSEITNVKINNCIGDFQLDDGIVTVAGNACARHTITLQGPIYPAQTFRVAEFQFSTFEGNPCVYLYWQYLSDSINENNLPRALLLAEIPR